MIVVRELTKIFPSGRGSTVCAADRISFTAERGQVFGLLGLNGAGKTTTLRMLGTILRPTSGTAEVAGFDVVQAGDEVRKRIGYLSGDTRLYDRLSARELLLYFGALNGLTAEAAGRKARELIARFALTAVAERRIGQLSTGLKQRVNIARALLHDPPVLILDEPTSGLDVLGAREVVELVREMRSEGRCVLLSTHMMHEAERVCDQVAIIHQGRLLAGGTPQALTGAHRELEDAFAALVGEGEPTR
ncbi:MAG TPA: ABC transporter ATP-binding protein [Candidatus Udaeobacter sp.]|nr:ABC transporter ATP-binding protein [Candidatus Udaeobacter sp.]